MSSHVLLDASIIISVMLAVMGRICARK